MLIEPMKARPGASASRFDVQLARSLEMVLMIVLPAAVLVIAWRNYRRGSSDRRGAFRLMLVFGATLVAASILRMHHPSTFRAEWTQASWIVSTSTFLALMIGIAYVAIEPLVRRRWPGMLIAWSRLLAGRWRDPMVGRDVLIGSLFGTGIALAQRMTAIAPPWFGFETLPLRDFATPLGSVRHVGMILLLGLLDSIARSIFAVVLLLLVRAVVRRLDVTIAISALLCGGAYVPDASGPLPVQIAYGLGVGAAVVLVAFRFGLLALVSTGYFATVLWKVPLTLDSSAWYFPRALLVLLVLGAICSFGFHVSLGGKRWLPRLSM